MKNGLAELVTFVLLFSIQVGILVFAVMVFVNGFFQ